jgi:hypothetical protein
LALPGLILGKIRANDSVYCFGIYSYELSSILKPGVINLEGRRSTLKDTTFYEGRNVQIFFTVTNTKLNIAIK